MRACVVCSVVGDMVNVLSRVPAAAEDLVMHYFAVARHEPLLLCEPFRHRERSRTMTSPFQ